MSKFKDIDLACKENIKKMENEMVIELLAETKQHKFTDVEMKNCIEINHIIFMRPKEISSNHLLVELSHKISPATLRKYIQLIRRNNDTFNDNGLFIIANSRGYKMSSNINEITNFFNKTQKRYSNTTSQLLHMKKTINWLEDRKECK